MTPSALKQLFHDNTAALGRRGFLQALVLLWIVNLLGIFQLIQGMASGALRSQGSGPAEMAADSIISSVLTGFSSGLPLSFLLLLGSVFLVHRIWGQPGRWIRKFMGGLCVFLLMRALTLGPFYLIYRGDWFTRSEEILSVVEPALRAWAIVIALVSLAGLVVLVIGWHRASPVTDRIHPVVGGAFVRKIACSFAGIWLVALGHVIMISLFPDLWANELHLPFTVGIPILSFMVFVLVAYIVQLKRTGKMMRLVVIPILATLAATPLAIAGVLTQDPLFFKLAMPCNEVGFLVNEVFLFWLILQRELA